MGFEPMIPVFKRAKEFHVLDRAATEIALRILRAIRTPCWINAFFLIVQQVKHKVATSLERIKLRIYTSIGAVSSH
jgi:hypothetical protein